MSILENKIRWWWIEKSVNDNIPTAAVFEAFQPTVKNGPDREWIRVISLDDFHKEAGMNITRWVEVCQDLVNAKQIIKNQLSRIERQAEDIKQLESEKAALAEKLLEETTTTDVEKAAMDYAEVATKNRPQIGWVIFDVKEAFKAGFTAGARSRDKEIEELKRDLKWALDTINHIWEIERAQLTTELEKLKRIVEVLEKSNWFYACGDSVIEDDIGKVPWEFLGNHYQINRHGRTARQAKEEVERIRKGEGR